MKTIRSLTLLLTMSLASACITADGVLAPDGSATLTLSYPAAAKTTEAQTKNILTATDVTVDSVTIEKLEEDGQPTARVTAKLSAAGAANFANVPLLQLFKTSIEHTRNDDGSGRLAVRLSTGKPASKSEADKAGSERVRVRVTLPGTVTETSATADGRAVEWTFLRTDLWEQGTQAMTAAYAAPSTEAAEDAPKPPATPPQDASS